MWFLQSRIGKQDVGANMYFFTTSAKVGRIPQRHWRTWSEVAMPYTRERKVENNYREMLGDRNLL